VDPLPVVRSVWVLVAASDAPAIDERTRLTGRGPPHGKRLDDLSRRPRALATNPIYGRPGRLGSRPAARV